MSMSISNSYKNKQAPIFKETKAANIAQIINHELTQMISDDLKRVKNNGHQILTFTVTSIVNITVKNMSK